MSREMTMKLNRILYQRSKDWLDNRPKTGILSMFGRGKPDKVEDERKKNDSLMIISGDILKQVIKQSTSEDSSEFRMCQAVIRESINQWCGDSPPWSFRGDRYVTTTE